MKQRKLTYIFHDPNPATAATADYLLNILIEANSGKVKEAIQETADKMKNRSDTIKHPI